VTSGATTTVLGKKTSDEEDRELEIAKEGLRKAAVFILSLDEETASVVLKSLTDKEAEMIAREIAKLGVLDKKEISSVLEEFRDLGKVHDFMRTGGTEQALKLIKKAFPENTANRLIRLLETQKQNVPFGFLKNTETDCLHTFLLEEHPQTIALVLSYASPAKAAEVLSKFPPERQFDIVNRIAHLEHTSPDAIKQVESGMKKYLTSLAFEEFQEIGGVKTVAEILNVIDRSTEKSIIENLENESPELVEEIKKLMFVFEDIMHVDDKGVQNVLKEIDNKQLALALKTASAELKEKIFKNMSQRAAEMLKEEIGYLGPVRVADVENAQQQIVDVVRRLEESGDVIVTGRGGEGDLIV
jgi:flagellar motor switch protein FliG